MSRFIVDASVAIKWVVREPGTDAALRLLEHPLAAPDLLTVECANILWKKARRNELTAPEAHMAARILAKVNITLAPMRDLLAPALELAQALDHPAYDCMYIALATSQQCDLVTADLTLVRKAAQCGMGARVIPLQA